MICGLPIIIFFHYRGQKTWHFVYGWVCKKAYRNTNEYMYICVCVYRSMEFILARNVFPNLINPPKSLTLLLLLPSEGRVNDQLLSVTITVKLFALSVSRCIDCNVIVIAMTMGAISSQITSLTVVYSTVYSDADQRKYQSSAPLAFVRGIHRGPVNSPHKWPVTRKMFRFDDVIMV